MNPIKPDDYTTAEQTWVGRWLQRNLWKLGGAVLMALAGIVADRFSDEVYAW